MISKKFIFILFFISNFNFCMFCLDKETQEKVNKQLIDAIKENDYSKVENALKSNANVNCIYSGRTPLYCACYNSSYEIARLLIEAGAIINTTDNNFSPFIIACTNGNLMLVKLLIRNGAIINNEILNILKINISDPKIKKLVTEFYDHCNYTQEKQFVDVKRAMPTIIQILLPPPILDIVASYSINTASDFLDKFEKIEIYKKKNISEFCIIS